MAHLVNRTDVWGGYRPPHERGKEYLKKNGAKGKLGSQTTRPAPSRRGQILLTEEVIVRHYVGRLAEHVIGLHSTSPANTSRWAATDIDWHGPASTAPEINLKAALGWYNKLRNLGFAPLLTDSNGKGGYHLRALFAEPIPTADAFEFACWLVSDYSAHGLPAAPETFPKQPRVTDRNPFGNWLRLPGRHHTHEHRSRVWDGDNWLDGAEAINFILDLTGSPPGLIPTTMRMERRIRAYMAKLPNLGEGQGRDDVAYNFAGFLVRDLKLPDRPDALYWLEEWDRGNNPPKGRERLLEIIANVHLYGQRPYGSGLNGKPHGPGRPGDIPPNGDEHPHDHFRPAEPEINEAADDPHRLARLYVDDYRVNGDPALVYWREEHHRWDGRAYRPVPPKEVRAELNGRIKQEFDRLNVLAIKQWEANGQANDKGDPVPKPAARKVNARLTSDTDQAISSLALLPGSVDPPTWLDGSKTEVARYPAGEMVACRNGLFHLPSAPRTKIYPHTPRFFTLNALAYDFNPNASPPEAWVKFLAMLWPKDPAAIQALQEWFGYCLTLDTRQQKILMLVGPKRSGKGTIARVQSNLVGLANVCAPTLASLGTQFGLSPLLGKSLAIISDARLSARTDAAVVVERLLSISGEDAQTVDRKYRSPVTARLPVRFMILTNELPRLNDPSGALVGRLILLRLTQSWYGQEDTGLTDRLLREMPSILLWAIEGWHRLQARGHFLQPSASKELLQDMEDLASPIGAFVRECCKLDSSGTACVHVQELFTRWKSWCDEKGRKETGNEATFGRDLRAALPALQVRQPRGGGGRIRVYVGIRLKTGRELEEEERQAQEEEEVTEHEPASF
jgi:putative DNA primase/helicase